MLGRRGFVAGLLGCVLTGKPDASAHRADRHPPRPRCYRFVYDYRETVVCRGRRCKRVRVPLYATACLVDPVCYVNGQEVDCAILDERTHDDEGR